MRVGKPINRTQRRDIASFDVAVFILTQMSPSGHRVGNITESRSTNYSKYQSDGDITSSRGRRPAHHHVPVGGDDVERVGRGHGGGGVDGDSPDPARLVTQILKLVINAS